jgi:hypothetical protein
MDPETDLQKGQTPSTVADVAKTGDLPHKKGIGPTAALAPTKTAVDFEIATAMAAENLVEVGVTHPEAVKRFFRDLGGTRGISWGKGEDWEDLPGPGGVPQHTEVGYRPRMEGESSLDKSKGTSNTTRATKMREEEEEKETGEIRLRHLSGKNFPLPGINKPPAPKRTGTRM